MTATTIPDLDMRLEISDTPGALGGWLEILGIDPADVFASCSIKDHPAIGRRVKLPVGVGMITDCIIHPRGRLMFDVDFDEPTLPFLVRKGTAGLECQFLTHAHYRDQSHRFFGHELKDLIIEVLPTAPPQEVHREQA